MLSNSHQTCGMKETSERMSESSWRCSAALFISSWPRGTFSLPRVMMESWEMRHVFSRSSCKKNQIKISHGFEIFSRFSR